MGKSLQYGEVGCIITNHKKGELGMRYSNLHNHSCFSDGEHTVAQIVAAAEEKNMLSIGFSDHSYTACDPSYCMALEQYDSYLRTIENAKRSSSIPVYAGIEQDYYSEMIFDGLDYVIASVHYIIKNGICYTVDHSLAQQQNCIVNAFGGNVLEMAKCYFDMLCEHVERVKPTFVGHFDVISKFSIMPEADDRYRTVVEDALKQIIKSCPYIECNTGAIARGLRTIPYPNPDFWNVIREEGGRIVLNADSHQKENLTFYFDEMVSLLKEKGFEAIYVFNGKDFDAVNI